MAAFIHDIAIVAYIPGNSPLHRLDPRTKLIGATALIIAAFGFGQPLHVVGHAVVIAVLATIARVGWRVWFWGISRFRWMLLIVAATGLLFHRGGEVLTAGGRELPVSPEGLVICLLFAAQVAEAVALSLLLTLTTTAADLTKGLQSLMRPLKRLGVPVEDLTLVLFLAMRFVPVLQQETRGIIDAQRSQGVEFHRGNLITRCRNLAALLVPSLTSTLRRADTLAVAMTSRGFQPGKPRSEFRPLEFSAADYWAAVILLVFVACEIAWGLIL